MKIVECEVCGAYTAYCDMQNNICPICCSVGSLFVNNNPSEEQLGQLKELDKT